MACSVVAITLAMPNGFSAARPMVRTMVEQLGLVTICPFQPRSFCGPRIPHNQIGDAGGSRAVEVPLSRVAILLAGRAIARAKPGQLEPGMALQKLDEMLAHHSSGAQDADFYSRFHKSLTMR